MQGVEFLKGYLGLYIYYYTPLPLNLANKQQASNKQQATSNTSPFRFGHYSVPPLRALLYSSHLIP